MKIFFLPTFQFSNFPFIILLSRRFWLLTFLLLSFLRLIPLLLRLISLVSVSAVFLFLLFLGTVHAADAVLSGSIFIFRLNFNFFFNVFFISQHGRKFILFIELDNFFYAFCAQCNPARCIFLVRAIFLFAFRFQCIPEQPLKNIRLTMKSSAVLCFQNHIRRR